MTKSIQTVISIIFASALLISCVEANHKGPYKVKIPVEQENGSVTIEVVELKTLKNPDSVDSDLIKVRLNSRSYKEGIDEKTPKAQYILTDKNVIIPRDTTTGQLFSLYKIMEDIYFFDISVGLNNLLKYPRIISLQTVEFGSSQSGSNNSRYDRGSDRISIFKTTQSNLIPMAMNKSVVIHEHSHAIFNHIVDPDSLLKSGSGVSGLIRRDIPVLNINSEELSEEKKWNYIFLDLLDEAIADYWVYNLTGREKLYNIEIPELNERKITGKVKKLKSQKDLEKILSPDLYFSKNKEDRLGIANEFQTLALQIGNFLKSLAEAQELYTRESRSKWIIETLQKVQSYSKNQKTKIQIQDAFDLFVFKKEKSTSESVCSLLNSFLENYPATESCL